MLLALDADTPVKVVFGQKILSKLEVAPHALKMLTGWMEWSGWVIPLREAVKNVLADFVR